MRHSERLIIDDSLRLIEPSLDHAQASLSWVSSPEVIGLMGADFSGPTLAGEEKRIKDILENDDECSWMIELDKKIIGNVSINSIAEMTEKFSVKAGNLTILIGEKNLWGQGIGAKVCARVLDWCFDAAGFKLIAARALKENSGSIRTLLKLGFTENGTEPYDGLLKGKSSTWHKFQLTAARWKNGTHN